MGRLGVEGEHHHLLAGALVDLGRLAGEVLGGGGHVGRERAGAAGLAGRARLHEDDVGRAPQDRRLHRAVVGEAAVDEVDRLPGLGEVLQVLGGEHGEDRARPDHHLDDPLGKEIQRHSAESQGRGAGRVVPRVGVEVQVIGEQRLGLAETARGDHQVPPEQVTLADGPAQFPHPCDRLGGGEDQGIAGPPLHLPRDDLRHPVRHGPVHARTPGQGLLPEQHEIAAHQGEGDEHEQRDHDEPCRVHVEVPPAPLHEELGEEDARPGHREQDRGRGRALAEPQPQVMAQVGVPQGAEGNRHLGAEHDPEEADEKDHSARPPRPAVASAHEDLEQADHQRQADQAQPQADGELEAGREADDPPLIESGPHLLEVAPPLGTLGDPQGHGQCVDRAPRGAHHEIDGEPAPRVPHVVLGERLLDGRHDAHLVGTLGSAPGQHHRDAWGFGLGAAAVLQIARDLVQGHGNPGVAVPLQVDVPHPGADLGVAFPGVLQLLEPSRHAVLEVGEEAPLHPFHGRMLRPSHHHVPGEDHVVQLRKAEDAELIAQFRRPLQGPVEHEGHRFPVSGGQVPQPEEGVGVGLGVLDALGPGLDAHLAKRVLGGEPRRGGDGVAEHEEQPPRGLGRAQVVHRVQGGVASHHRHGVVGVPEPALAVVATHGGQVAEVPGGAGIVGLVLAQGVEGGAEHGEIDPALLHPVEEFAIAAQGQLEAERRIAPLGDPLEHRAPVLELPLEGHHAHAHHVGVGGLLGRGAGDAPEGAEAESGEQGDPEQEGHGRSRGVGSGEYGVPGRAGNRPPFPPVSQRGIMPRLVRTHGSTTRIPSP